MKTKVYYIQWTIRAHLNSLAHLIRVYIPQHTGSCMTLLCYHTAGHTHWDQHTHYHLEWQGSVQLIVPN